MPLHQFQPFPDRDCYFNRRRKSDAFLPAIRRIIADHVIVDATEAQDHFEATDMVVLHTAAGRYAIRTRSAGSDKQYAFDFTIRSWHRTVQKTEIHKILEGWGDRFFYGHQGHDGVSIVKWWLIDLHSFRDQMNRSGGRCGHISGGVFERLNTDRETKLRVFNLQYFEPSIIVAGSHIDELTFQGWR